MRIAFVYPGQGVQKTGMGKDFVEAYPWAKEMLDKASSVSGLDLDDLIFNEENQEKLNITRYTQPALTAIELIIAEALKREGIEPMITAGLSLGEYSALVTSGVLSFEDAVKVTAIRGKLMEEAAPDIGGMAAVIGMEDEAILEAIKDVENVWVANYNCPGQAVITGLKEKVDEACEILSNSGARKLVKLNCSGPFHSPLLNKASEELYKELENVNINKPEISYAINVSGEVINPEDDADVRTNLKNQITSSVRFKQSLVAMNENNVDLFIEIGPGKTINGFLRKTFGNDAAVLNVATVEDVMKAKAIIDEVLSKS